MANPATTLTFRSVSTRCEGYQAAECCHDHFYLLPNLVIEVTSRGRRHAAVTTISFIDAQGEQTTFEGWAQSWAAIVDTLEMDRPAHVVDALSIGLRIETRTYGKTAFVGSKLLLRNGQSVLSWFKHWRFEAVEGELPALIDVSTGKAAQREGATYHCYRLL